MAGSAREAMAEVTGVLREMQLNTEGGLVPARGSVPLYSKAVGATKADRKMAVTRNKSFIGVPNAEVSNKKAAMAKAASWSDFGTSGSKPAAGNKAAPGEERKAEAITKADAESKEAAGRFTGEIGVAKADAGNKEAAGLVTAEIGVTKPHAANKEAVGSLTVEIGLTQAEAGIKEAGEIGDTEAEAGKEASGKGVVTEAAWIEFVFPKPPLELLERKAEPTGALIAKEMVPDVIVNRLLMKSPFQKLPPIRNKSDLYNQYPKLRESYLSTMAHWNYLVDLHADVLRQVKEKRYAEVGVDFTGGDKKMFILPRPAQRCAP